MRILVVDDEDAPRQRLLDALEASGHSVVPAESGREALTVLGEEPIDVVITDVVMPDLDGIQLVRRVTRMHPDVKSIVLSASDYSQDDVFLKLARIMGAAATFKKSVSLAELMVVIETFARR